VKRLKQEFKAVIQQHESKNAAYVEPPFDVQEVFGSKRVKVKATFDGVEYRGSVVNMGGCYMIGLTQEIRNKIGKGFGDEIFVTLEKDVEERTVELPDDFASAMNGEEKAVHTFQTLPFTAQKEYVTWITSAKREATRSDRVTKAVALLSEGKRLR
jgi:hypothetical protein